MADSGIGHAQRHPDQYSPGDDSADAKHAGQSGLAHGGRNELDQHGVDGNRDELDGLAAGRQPAAALVVAGAGSGGRFRDTLALQLLAAQGTGPSLPLTHFINVEPR